MALDYVLHFDFHLFFTFPAIEPLSGLTVGHVLGQDDLITTPGDLCVGATVIELVLEVCNPGDQLSS